MRKQYTLFWGVLAQCTYVGAQVSIANYFINYSLAVRPDFDNARGSDQLAIAQSLFAIGRFAATGCMKFFTPRLVYLAFMCGCIVFIACAIGVPGSGGIACLSIVLFFESCIFPTIFTLSLRGLGRHTKRGASFLVSSICGGAFWPPMTGAIIDAKGPQVAMLMPLIGFVISGTYPVYLNLCKAKELDAYRAVEIGVKQSLKRGSHVEEGMDDEKEVKEADIKEIEDSP